jgi:glycosyltransferase involved in cell wall biosynthesis
MKKSTFQLGQKRSEEQLDLVRFVLVASKTGKYGGPYDTAVSQHILTGKLDQVLIAGVFKGDEPENFTVKSKYFPARHLLGMKSFVDVGSFRMLQTLWNYANPRVSHISFSRGITTYIYTIMCFLRGSSVVMQTHGMLTSRTSAFHRTIDFVVTKRLLAAATTVMALTDTERVDLLSRFPFLKEKITVLGNPSLINFAYEGTQPYPKVPVVLAACRLHTRKRPLDFALAARDSYQRGTQVDYHLLGPDEGCLKGIMEISLSLPNFRYLGATDNNGVSEKLKSASIFALTSSNEPWGNVLVAALKMGKPVVVTESSHLASLVLEYKAGVVIPDGDPISISAAVREISEKANYKNYSRNAARLGLEKFDNSVIAHGLFEIYQKANFRKGLQGIN